MSTYAGRLFALLMAQPPEAPRPDEPVERPPGTDAWVAGSAWARRRGPAVLFVQRVANKSGGKLQVMRREPGQTKATLATSLSEFNTPEGQALLRLMAEQADIHSGARRRRQTKAGKASAQEQSARRAAKAAVVLAMIAAHPDRPNTFISARLRGMKVDPVTISPQAIGQHRKKAKANIHR